MKIAIACDHGGFALKEAVKGRLLELGHEVEDFGVFSEESVDYPDVGRPAAQAVADGKAERGVLICGTGIGMSIVANKVRGIRAALVSEPFSARMTRAHNDANILVMGGRVIGIEMAYEILETFLNTPFDGGRHQRRIDKLEG